MKKNSIEFNEFSRFSQLMAANKLLQEYLSVSKVVAELNRNTSTKIDSVEPEFFAEGWLKACITGTDDEWKNQVFVFFIELLCGYNYKEENNE